MLYILAFICPPLACLFTGRVFDTVANLIVSAIGVAVAGPLGYLAALFHAFYVIHEAHKEARCMAMADRVMRILDRN